MRINDKFFPSNEPISESSRFLNEVIDKITYNLPPPISNVPPMTIDPKLEEFYEKYCVSLGEDFDLPSDCSMPNLKVSSYENRIIQFCLSDISETRIHVLHGHTGVGKSTLLRRLFYYVYPKCPSLQKSFFPIYIHMTPDMASHESEKAFTRIADIVCRNAYDIIQKEVLADTESILNRVNKRGRVSYGRISKSNIHEAKQDFEKWVSSFFIDHQSRIDFYLDILELLILDAKLRLIVVLDDVDTYDGDIHANTFLALDMLTPYGINAVVAMRTSTYKSESAQFLQSLDHRTEIVLTSDSIWAILKRRVDQLDRTIQLYPSIAYRIPNLETVKGSDVVDAFSRLISQKICMRALIGLSNTNIKSIFSKLNLMSKSEAFSDSFIVHQLLDRETVAPHKDQPGKIWIFYHLLLGNYAGTYRRDPEAQKAGIINVFDSSTEINNPWRHFIKLIVLIHLYINLNISHNEDDYTQCSEILENLKATFGTSLRTSLFIDALEELVNSELVFTGSCKKYSVVTINSGILSDSIRISFAGRYLLENLMHKVEYLFFMKDDIDWRIEKFPPALTPAGRDYDRKVKFLSVLEALRLLLEQEYICLASLRAEWLDKQEYLEALRRYRDLFSPYHLPNSAGLMICETILRNYKVFIMSVLSDSYVGSAVEKKIREIEDIIEDNEDIRKAFLQA